MWTNANAALRESKCSFNSSVLGLHPASHANNFGVDVSVKRNHVNGTLSLVMLSSFLAGIEREVRSVLNISRRVICNELERICKSCSGKTQGVFTAASSRYV